MVKRCLVWMANVYCYLVCWGIHWLCVGTWRGSVGLAWLMARSAAWFLVAMLMTLAWLSRFASDPKGTALEVKALAVAQLERLAGWTISVGFRLLDGLHYRGPRQVPALVWCLDALLPLPAPEPAEPAPELAEPVDDDLDWPDDTVVTIPGLRAAPAPVEEPPAPEAIAPTTPSPTEAESIPEDVRPLLMPSAAQMTEWVPPADDELVFRARELLGQGHSRRAVAKMLGVAESTLRGKLKRASA